MYGNYISTPTSKLIIATHLLPEEDGSGTVHLNRIWCKDHQK